jgi:hypothetical protein
VRCCCVLQREIKILADLGDGHLNIVHADEVLLTRTHVGLVMEYVSGGQACGRVHCISYVLCLLQLSITAMLTTTILQFSWQQCMAATPPRALAAMQIAQCWLVSMILTYCNESDVVASCIDRLGQCAIRAPLSCRCQPNFVTSLSLLCCMWQRT